MGLLDKTIDNRIRALITDEQKEYLGVRLGCPTAWSWFSVVPDSYYPNALLRDFSRLPTAAYKSVDGTVGVSTTISVLDANGTTRDLIFKDGLLTGKENLM